MITRTRECSNPAQCAGESPDHLAQRLYRFPVACAGALAVAEHAAAMCRAYPSRLDPRDKIWRSYSGHASCLD